MSAVTMARRSGLGWLLGMPVLCVLTGWLAVSSAGIGLTRQQTIVVVAVAAALAVAVLTARAVRVEPVGEPGGRSLYAFPVMVAAAATSLGANGIDGALPHQFAWGVIGVVMAVVFAVSARSAGRRVVPLWLAFYAIAGLTLEVAQSRGNRAILDIGLSSLCLFVMWHVACALRAPGGAMRFLKAVAACFWAATVVGVAVEYVGVAIGSMTRATTTLPWQLPIGNVFVNGDYQGWGFVTTQTGREAAFVVCVYHIVRWRYTHRALHGWLGATALLLFLTTYGRVPFLGGLLGLLIVLLTTRTGTQVVRVASAAVVLAVAFLVSGAGHQIASVDSRVGAHNFDTGHFSLWSQHLGLLAEQPLVGVGGAPTQAMIVKTWQQPVIRSSASLPQIELLDRGSRGEGGWTGLLAQRGIVNGGIILGLLVLALGYVFTRFPAGDTAQQDMVVLRAIIPASFVFYVTDVAPMSVYTVTAYVLGQLSMIAVVRYREPGEPVTRLR